MTNISERDTRCLHVLRLWRCSCIDGLCVNAYVFHWTFSVYIEPTVVGGLNYNYYNYNNYKIFDFQVLSSVKLNWQSSFIVTPRCVTVGSQKSYLNYFIFFTLLNLKNYRQSKANLLNVLFRTSYCFVLTKGRDLCDLYQRSDSCTLHVGFV